MDNGNLIDGCDYPEHEDCLLGDEKGLRNLIEACEKALEEGECFTDNLGEYSGVKRLNSSWFDQEYNQESSIKDKVILYTIVTVVGGLLLIGVKTVVQWLI
ncbi:Uncharacterised protein [BD1-7 clade bacterium]|uniref:Uncharacterized protein n=1 Tax=BD1-7 clade bacterium TaxID=2029982 RepID=A0A5S9Q872_9GAMM|nr:Uncharacterised protein [BD1-7 clade bacterium]CAA0113770.1 Uncharacterised protein [BD1-7 clade bacterium]